jgi:hypothetical protein
MDLSHHLRLSTHLYLRHHIKYYTHHPRMSLIQKTKSIYMHLYLPSA